MESEIIGYIANAIDEGSTPLIGMIVYYLMKLNKKLEKVDTIHADINAFIRKMAKLNGEHVD